VSIIVIHVTKKALSSSPGRCMSHVTCIAIIDTIIHHIHHIHHILTNCTYHIRHTTYDAYIFDTYTYTYTSIRLSVIRIASDTTQLRSPSTTTSNTYYALGNIILLPSYCLFIPFSYYLFISSLYTYYFYTL
jgi:hypothetical protein